MRRLPVLVAVLVLGAVGCTGDKSPTTQTSVSPSASSGAAAAPTSPTSAAVSSAASAAPTTPPVDDPAARAALTTLAAKSAAASYDATYEFQAARSKGLLRIVASPPRFRVDITIGPQTAQFYRIDVGTVSCGIRADKPPTCALVAKPGEQVPDAFDPGVQRLFTEGLDALADNPEGYAVAPLPNSPAASGLGESTCFHVERLADLELVSPGTVTPPGRGFESGDYCFDPPTAVLTSVGVQAGTLKISNPPAPPADKDFTPPATPQPLAPSPSLSAAAPSSN